MTGDPEKKGLGSPDYRELLVLAFLSSRWSLEPTVALENGNVQMWLNTALVISIDAKQQQKQRALTMLTIVTALGIQGTSIKTVKIATDPAVAK